MEMKIVPHQGESLQSLNTIIQNPSFYSVSNSADFDGFWWKIRNYFY